MCVCWWVCWYAYSRPETKNKSYSYSVSCLSVSKLYFPSSFWMISNFLKSRTNPICQKQRQHLKNRLLLVFEVVVDHVSCESPPTEMHWVNSKQCSFKHNVQDEDCRWNRCFSQLWYNTPNRKSCTVFRLRHTFIDSYHFSFHWSFNIFNCV